MCKGAIRGSQHCQTLLMGHGFLCVPQQRLLRKACPGQTLFWRNEDGAAPKAPLPLVNSRQAERCYSKNLLCTPSAQCCNDEFRYLKAWPKESIHFFHSHPHADLGSVTAKVGLLKKKTIKIFSVAPSFRAAQEERGQALVAPCGPGSPQAFRMSCSRSVRPAGCGLAAAPARLAGRPDPRPARSEDESGLAARWDQIPLPE